MGERRQGVAYGIAAYGIWGLFPLYWRLLAPAGPFEVVAHRIVWSLLFCLILLAYFGDWSWLRPLLGRPRALLALSAAAVVIAVNWTVYVAATVSGHVLEAALGYFINPLVSVMLGVGVLRERLRPWQWAAVAVGTVAVGVLAVDYGRPPWIALTLAFSFGTYGLLKKVVAMPAGQGLAAETAMQALPAAGLLIWLEITGSGTFGHTSWLTTALLAGTGVATAVPLLCFAGAARRLPLSTVGLLQYLAPIFQFSLGLFVFGEPMPAARWIGFVLVWIALLVFAVDALRGQRYSATEVGTRPAESTAVPVTPRP
jgi:chloramphenicol-sensitive protein RarD